MRHQAADPVKARYEDALRVIAGGGAADPELIARAALEDEPVKPGRKTRRSDLIPIDAILCNLQVRAMCGRGRQPVPRSTLILWRKKHGFPEPFAVLPGDVELWDRRAVRRWKRNRRRRLGEKF